MEPGSSPIAANSSVRDVAFVKITESENPTALVKVVGGDVSMTIDSAVLCGDHSDAKSTAEADSVCMPGASVGSTAPSRATT
jgi:hypothetical protein